MVKPLYFDFGVNRYLRDYDETSGKVTSQDYVVQKTYLKSQAIAWNPLAAYHMVRRFSTDLKALVKSFNLSKVTQLSKLCLLYIIHIFQLILAMW